MSYLKKPIANIRALYDFILYGVATFTNKTFTNPVITTPTITTPSFNNTTLKGSRFAVTLSPIAYASRAIAFFIAPAGCKVVSARETHGTACDTTDTMTIEKCNTGEDAGAGDVVLATAFTLNSTVNVPVTSAAVADGKEILVAGDCLMLKAASGDWTTYAEGCVTVTMEWT